MDAPVTIAMGSIHSFIAFKILTLRRDP
jgi:hypothetical protein